MDGSATRILASPYWWLIAVAVVVLGQAKLALPLFGERDALTGLTDARPIISGRHPLHLYHGSLGAATFRERYGTACYDPAFQAGYPKTPVFDGGCRPAEFFLAWTGQTFDPAAYKLGLFGVCVLAPLAFALAAWCVGLSPTGVVLASAGGCLVWWSAPVQTMLAAGNFDLLIAGLTGLIFICGLPRYASEPGPLTWCILAGSAVVGWYAQPVMWLGLFPVGMAYYVIVAPRHGLAWHLGQVGVFIAGLVPNLWWLTDWVKFWWLRSPTVDDLSQLPCWFTLLGTIDDYFSLFGTDWLSWSVVLFGLVGIGSMMGAGRRVCGGVLLSTVVLAVIVARLGQAIPMLKVLHAERAASFVVGVLMIPSACLLSRWWSQAQFGNAVVAVVAALPLLAGVLGVYAPPPLPLGFNDERREFIAAITKFTTPEARILLEEPDSLTKPGWNWTALLPVLTDRAYLGGLDPDANVEHSYCSFRNGKLNGRALAEWTSLERDEFVQRYNVGWVMCRSPAAISWWANYPGAKAVAQFRESGDVVLFALDRKPSFILSGTATLERADRRKIVLTDVTPNEAGEVVLSFHYQPGFRIIPSMLHIEGDKELFDPIPMTKLRLPGPVSRVVLVWDNP